MHERLASDVIALDRGAEPEGGEPLDHEVMDFRPGRLPAQDEPFVLEKIPAEFCRVRLWVTVRQSDEHARLPEQRDVTSRGLRLSRHEGDVEPALVDSRDVLARRTFPDVDRDRGMFLRSTSMVLR